MRIINFMTQEDGYTHGARPESPALSHERGSLMELIEIIANEAIASVALPKHAAGVGVLDLDDACTVAK